jgi:transcriptional regulator with XRE-family HTH domain
MPRKLTGFLPQRAEMRDATATEVSAIIKAIRRRLNVSQERLAHQAGVDRTYVAKVERAILNPTIYRMNRVLRAAGVSWREFGEALDAALDAELAAHSRHTRRAP